MVCVDGIMIYTIGHKASYLKAIAEQGQVMKLGKKPSCDEFPGGYADGYAVKTRHDAQRLLKHIRHYDGWVDLQGTSGTPYRGQNRTRNRLLHQQSRPRRQTNPARYT